MERVEGGCQWVGEEEREGAAATNWGEGEGSARVGEERGSLHRIEINGPNSLSHLSCRPQWKKCQTIYCFLRNASRNSKPQCHRT
jgi:hypothetical protein